jgi:hypothetical protein
VHQVYWFGPQNHEAESLVAHGDISKLVSRLSEGTIFPLYGNRLG